MRFLIGAAVVGVLSLSGVAAAQEVLFQAPGPAPIQVPLETQAQDDPQAIRAESHQATALYVSASCILFNGVVALAGSGIAALSSGLGGGDTGVFYFLLGTAGVLGGIGLVLYVPAIILDIDSGVRRRRYEQSTGVQMTLRLGPGSLALAGTF